MSSFLHTAGGLCSQKPMIYLEPPHSDPCYFLPVALRLRAPRRASFVTRNAIWLRRRTLHQRGRRRREGVVAGRGIICRYSSYLLTPSVKKSTEAFKIGPLPRGPRWGTCEVTLLPVAFIHSSVANCFPSTCKMEQMLPGWIVTCPCLLMHHWMSYGRTGAWPRNKYLLAERVLAWTRSECAPWQITLEIIAQISAQGGEWRLCNSYGMQFKPFRNWVPQSITPLLVASATDATRLLFFLPITVIPLCLVVTRVNHGCPCWCALLFGAQTKVTNPLKSGGGGGGAICCFLCGAAFVFLQPHYVYSHETRLTEEW